MTEQELLYASPEDIDFFNKCIDGLPKAGEGLDSNGLPMPYACGPHSVRCFREIVEIVRPETMLEIGFNVGYSAAMWLELVKEITGLYLRDFTTCDISDRQETWNASLILDAKHLAFQFFIRSTPLIYELDQRQFDLAFIDGDHNYGAVVVDIESCLALRIKYLAFDDWLHQYGPGVQSAISKFTQLEMVQVFGNIALFKNTAV